MIISKEKLERLKQVQREIYKYCDEAESIINSLPDCEELGYDKLEAEVWGSDGGLFDVIDHVISLAERDGATDDMG